MKRKSALITVIALAVSLVFGSLLSAVSAAAPQDAQKHWAADAIAKWTDAGWIKGYPDGSFKPDAPVKRAEFAALVNRAFGLTEEGEDVSFKDLPQENWAYHDVAVAVGAGYIHGTGDGNVSPNGNTTRQEAAVMIASLLHLSAEQDADLSRFRDAGQVAQWGRSAVAALAGLNVFKGDTAGHFRPTAPITRAEAIVALDAALALKAPVVYDKPGVVGSVYGNDTINGDVVIDSDGVTLQNTTINGNLTITEKVGEGDVTLKKVTVNGTITVKGGGENSVHLEDSVLLRVIVDKPTGKVRIVAIGATAVQDVIVNSPVKIEESHVTDSGFSNIELADALPKGSSVDLVGQFEDVRVLSANIQLNIPSGSIGSLSVAESAADNTINLGSEAHVLQLVLDTVSKLIGQGTVDKATIGEQAKGSSFEKAPAQVDGDGKDGIATPPAAPSGPSTPPSGGDNGSDDDEGNGGIPPTECTEHCDDASLSALSVASSVYDFQLVRVDPMRNTLGGDFAPDWLSYSTTVPQDFTESDVTISVAAATYATVEYFVQYDDASTTHGIVNSEDRSFNVHLKPSQDAAINFIVYSADLENFKSYTLYFLYDRNLQQAFRLTNRSADPDHPLYYLESDALQAGDAVSVTFPAATNPITGTVIDSGVYLYLPGFDAQQSQPLHVVVTRADEVIMDGDYDYDLTPVSRLENDEDAVQVKLAAKDELQAHDAQSYDVEHVAYSWSLTLDKSKASSLLQSAKSFSFASTDIVYTNTTAPDLTNEDLKFSYDKRNAVYHLTSLYEDQPSTIWFYRDDVYDQYLTLFFYGEDNQLIGAYTCTLDFDADHIGVDATLVPPAEPGTDDGI